MLGTSNRNKKSALPNMVISYFYCLNTHLYLSSTIAAGSNSVIASSKYVSRDGRKSLSLDLQASRLLGHRFHNLVSSGLSKNKVKLYSNELCSNKHK